MAIDVLRTEQLVGGIADVVNFNYGLFTNFMLNTEVVVVHVWVIDALRLDDSGQNCLVRTEWCPTCQVASCLSSETLPRIGRRPGKCGRGSTRDTSCG